MSIPRRNRERLQSRVNSTPQDYNPNNVGHTMYDSLKIFDLGYAATYTEVKVQYRALARIYHSDKHNPKRTVMTDDEATNHFQLINSASKYLKSKL